MASEQWPGAAADGSTPQGLQPQQLPQQPSAHEDQLDRQMLRHLMRKYTTEGLARLMQEEETTTSSNPSLNETASILTTSTYSSAKSEDAASVFDSGSSVRAFSDTSSGRGSIISNVSARTAKFLSRKSSNASSLRHDKTHTSQEVVNGSASQWDVSDAASTHSGEHGSVTNAAKQKGTFMCGFCKEEGIIKTCTRKNDLKRHIEDFHNMNAQWFCQHRGCNLVFDWPTVYKTHLKHTHGGSRTNLEEAKVSLCPQTVFACGFEKCIQVFESPSDLDAGNVFKEYVAHVVKHLDEGSNSGEWNYSTRIRNLMRQSGVLRAWQTSSWPEADRNRLTWEPQHSGNLRKRLETKHIGDAQMLVQYAITLATSPNSARDMHQSFAIPVMDECRMQMNGHKSRPQLPLQAPQAPEADPFSFKISRGPSNPHPQLANYLAHQRRMYAPRPPVRAGRSARPPMNSVAANSHNFHQSQAPAQAPAPSMFDPTGFYTQSSSDHHKSQQQQHPQQQYAMMPPTDGGIIADDLRSLQSMASSNQSSDVTMGDAQMMDSSYMNHQSFSGPYAPSLQSSASMDIGGTGDVKMEHHDQFSPYGTQNGY